MSYRARVSEAQVLWLTDILTANRQGQTPSNTDTGTPSTSGGGRMPTADDIKALQADAGTWLTVTVSCTAYSGCLTVCSWVGMHGNAGRTHVGHTCRTHM